MEAPSRRGSCSDVRSSLAVSSWRFSHPLSCVHSVCCSPRHSEFKSKSQQIELPLDDDGDVDLDRSRRCRCPSSSNPSISVFSVFHVNGILSVGQVGRTIWRGSINLANFLIKYPELLQVTRPESKRCNLPASNHCVMENGEVSVVQYRGRDAIDLHGGETLRVSSSSVPSVTLPSDLKTSGEADDKRRIFRILELGSGVGLLGLVIRCIVMGTARFASDTDISGVCAREETDIELFLTDTDETALSLCELSQDLVCKEMNEIDPRATTGIPLRKLTTKVRRLDWREMNIWDASEAIVNSRIDCVQAWCTTNKFSWSATELNALRNRDSLNVILACDVLYDFDSTDSFAHLVANLLRRHRGCRCFMSQTRRLGFSCITSEVPVDVFVEHFFDTYVRTKTAAQSAPQFNGHVHCDGMNTHAKEVHNSTSYRCFFDAVLYDAPPSCLQYISTELLKSDFTCGTSDNGIRNLERLIRKNFGGVLRPSKDRGRMILRDRYECAPVAHSQDSVPNIGPSSSAPVLHSLASEIDDASALADVWEIRLVTVSGDS